MLTTHHVKIKAIHTVVPSQVEETMDLPFDRDHLLRVCDASGIRQRHVAGSTTAYDLALSVAQSLLDGISSPSEVGAIVYVTQTPKTTIPSEAHLLQHALGLGHGVSAITITEGCAGYVYGMQTAASLVSSSNKAVLLVVADTISKLVDPDDSGTRPLFGDGASATLLVPDDSSELTISTGSDGGGAQHIELDKGVLKMDGMEVFMFGIRKVPKLLTAFLASIDKQVQDFDYLVLHQANQLMIDRIGKKLGSAPDQVIKSLSQYGNTSGASIPLAITHQLSADREVPIRLLLCGFGAGLAWGMVSCMLDGETLLSHELYNNDEVC